MWIFDIVFSASSCLRAEAMRSGGEAEHVMIKIGKVASKIDLDSTFDMENRLIR